MVYLIPVVWLKSTVSNKPTLNPATFKGFILCVEESFYRVNKLPGLHIPEVLVVAHHFPQVDLLKLIYSKGGRITPAPVYFFSASSSSSVPKNLPIKLVSSLSRSWSIPT